MREVAINKFSHHVLYSVHNKDCRDDVTVTIDEDPQLQDAIVTVKDHLGNADLYPIAVKAKNAMIDLETELKINTAFGSIRLYSDGANWFTW